MRYDIADILETREAGDLRRMMQEDFEQRIGQGRYFRITATYGREHIPFFDENGRSTL